MSNQYYPTVEDLKDNVRYYLSIPQFVAPEDWRALGRLFLRLKQIKYAEECEKHALEIEANA